MTEKRARYITSNAFPEPNYTQTPNAFFDMLSDMENSEVKVTLVMIRNTFGFHRSTFKMGINKLVEATGLSRNAVKDGAEAAENRGTFRRTNPTEQSEAEWELVVGQPVTTLNECLLDGQSVTTEWSISDQQVRVKERKESNKEINDNEQPLATLSKLYSDNIGAITPLGADLLRNISIDYPESWFKPAFEIAIQNNARNLKYIETILRGWKDHEFGWKPEKQSKTPKYTAQQSDRSSMIRPIS